MKSDDLFSYLMVTDQLDEFLGLKNIIKCPNCNKELYKYDNNLLYCKKCKILFEYNDNINIDNKQLSYSDKRNIRE